MSARYRLHINIGNLWSLPDTSSVPRTDNEIDWAAIRQAGFAGLQHYFPEPAALAAGLEMSGMGRFTDPSEAKALAKQHKEWGFVCTTLHVGTGLETDAEMDALASAVLDASVETGLPLYIETHRATMTQDIRRTIDLCMRFPDLRFNADLSHWYTGHELRYGDFEAKLAALAPVLERVRYVHGRVGDSCAMQLPLVDARELQAWEDFEILWRGCHDGFARAGADEPTIFAPELLPRELEFGGTVHRLNYAKEVAGKELSDRWEEAQEICRLFGDARVTGGQQAA